MAGPSTRWQRGAAGGLGRGDQARRPDAGFDKVYEFTIRFGEETDTLDAGGAVVATSEVRPSLAQVEAVLGRFTGEIEQVPPAYSALKVEGTRAYALARAGAEVGAEEPEGHGGQPHPSSPRKRGSGLNRPDRTERPDSIPAFAGMTK